MGRNNQRTTGHVTVSGEPISDMDKRTTGRGGHVPDTGQRDVYANEHGRDIFAIIPNEPQRHDVNHNHAKRRGDFFAENAVEAMHNVQFRTKAKTKTITRDMTFAMNVQVFYLYN